MKRSDFLKKSIALLGLSILPKQVVNAQFGISNAGIILVLERIWTQAFTSSETLKTLFKQTEDFVTDATQVVDFLELKGWFQKIASYNQELAHIAYTLKQVINVYNLAKEFQGQINNIQTAQEHYTKAFKIALKALSPSTRATIKERVELFKEADKEAAEGRKAIKQVEVLIQNRVTQIQRQQVYPVKIKNQFK